MQVANEVWLFYFSRLLKVLVTCSAIVCENSSTLVDAENCCWFSQQQVNLVLRIKWRLIFTIVVRCSRLQLSEGYFIYFEFTPVFF